MMSLGGSRPSGNGGLRRYLAAFAVFAALFSGLSEAARVDFRQCQNDNAQGSKNDGVVDPCVWANGAINPNNSIYGEGTEVSHRLILTDFDAAGPQTLVFRHDFSKGDAYAYDFLADADQTTPQILLNPCGNLPSNPSLSFEQCFALYSNAALVPVPSDPFDDVASREFPQTQNLTLGCIDPTVSPPVAVNCGATVTSIVHEQASGAPIPGGTCFQDCGDSVSIVTVQFNAPATDTIFGMWFGGHLAIGEDANPIPPDQGWGTGFGAASAPGASFDVRMVSLNGSSLGSLVNQIQTSTVQAGQSADLSITKTDNIDPITAGNDLTYTLSVANNGPGTVAQVIVEDTLPGGVTFVSAAPGQGSCVENAGTIDCNLGLMNPGDVVAIPITVGVPLALAGSTITNTAVVSGSVDDVPGNNTATEDTTVQAPPPDPVDLQIVKSDNPDPVVAGAQLTYTLTVTNLDDSIDATGVTVSDVVPGGTTFVSATPEAGSCSFNAGVIQCALGTIAAQDSVQIEIVVDVDPLRRQDITNVATVAGNEADPNPNNNEAEEVTTVDAETDLSISKTDNPDPVVAGNQLAYTVVIQNLGTSSSNGAEMIDTLPPEVSFISATPQQGTGCSHNPTTREVTCDLGVLQSGDNTSIVILVQVDASTPDNTTITNLASTRCNELTCKEIDIDPSNNTTSEDTLVIAPAPELEADLGITKADSADPVVAGESLTYTMVVTNYGPNAAEGVVFSDSLPAELSVVAVTPTQGTCSSGDQLVACNLGTLVNGATATIEIEATVLSSTVGVLTNTATVSANTPDPGPNPNTATEETTVTAQTDMGILKSDSPDPVSPGASLTYTIIVTNHGPSDSTGSVATDTLPAGVTFNDAASSDSCTEATAGVLECNVGNLPAGDSRTFNIVVDVDDSTTGTLTNSVTVVGNEPEPDPDEFPNTAEATTEVNEVPTPEVDLGVSKTGSPSPAVAGRELTYTIVVTNFSGNEAENVRLADPLPGRVTYVSATPSQGSCSESGGLVTCNLGNLAGGANATITIVTTVDEGASQTLTNVATVSSNNPEPNPDPNPNTTSYPTRLSPPDPTDLGIVKVDSPDPVNPGGTLTYTITVTNHGPADSTGSVATDELPSGVTYNDAASSPLCDETTPGFVSCNVPALAVDASRQFNIVVTVDEDAPETLSNSITVAGNEPEPIPQEFPNSAQASTTVADAPALNVDANTVCINDMAIVQTVATTNFDPGTSPIETLWEPTTSSVPTTYSQNVPVNWTEGPAGTWTSNSVNILWPGMEVEEGGVVKTVTVDNPVAATPVGWTGWLFINGEWEFDETYPGGNLRPQGQVTFTVNPDFGPVVGTYPPALPNCSPNPRAGVGGIEVSKSASPKEIPSGFAEVTYSFLVANLSPSTNFMLESLVDTIYGDLNGQGDCSVPQTIAPSGTYSCSITVPVGGQEGQEIVNVVIGAGVDGQGVRSEDRGEAVVTVKLRTAEIPALSPLGLVLLSVLLGLVGAARQRMRRR